MFFYSTRDKNNHKTVSQAILQGLAEDGGLFVPEYFPQINWAELDPQLSYPQFAAKILADYFKVNLAKFATMLSISHSLWNNLMTILMSWNYFKVQPYRLKILVHAS